MKILPHIYVADSGNKGRGVFTALDISLSSIIEICPLILIPNSQTSLIDQTEIYNYYFVWDDNNLAMALGYGSLYNHSDDPNARVIFDFETNEIQIEAIRNIVEGEEISINYLDVDDQSHTLWFENKE